MPGKLSAAATTTTTDDTFTPLGDGELALGAEKRESPVC